MNLSKKKLVLATVGVLIILIIIYGFGNSTAKVSLGKEKVTYNGIEDKIKEKDDELALLEKKVSNKESEVRSKIIELENKLTGKEKEVNEALELVKQKDSITSELEKLKGELSTLTKNVNEKQTVLASLDTQIKAKKDAPISLGAGQYVVGKDLKSGRYKVTPVGSGSNFFVYDSNGLAEVNIILGHDSYSVPDYVFFTTEGNIIETHAPVKLTVVE